MFNSGLAGMLIDAIIGSQNNYPGRSSQVGRGWSGPGSLTGGAGGNNEIEQAKIDAAKADAAMRYGGGGFGGGEFGGGVSGGGPPSGFGQGYGGGPTGSEFGALNHSSGTRGSAPRYHEGIPMGGTPGVWAIRNDEIMHGPQQDAYWLTGDWKGQGGRRRYRGGR